jgi:CheY-like chemotaxis protein
MSNKPVFEGEVLLCEDNKMNQELICERLTRAGLKTITAENGRDGVEITASRIQSGIKPFDLIFMDIYMPIMDGFEAATEIGKLNTGTPIIAMTASSDPAEKDRFAAHGMSDHVNKPFTSQELLACLMKYLKPVNSDSPNEDPQSEEKLKIKLINNFLTGNKTVYDEIIKAIDEKDIKLAHRLAHTLKSNAGMLGKTRLQEAAGDTEHLLENEENRTNQSVLNILKTELEAAINELEPLAVKENVVSETKHGALGESETRALLDELETLLDGGDSECLNLINRLQMIPGSDGPVVHVSLIRGLIQQMEYFEFDAAMETLARLKQELTGTGHE